VAAERALAVAGRFVGDRHGGRAGTEVSDVRHPSVDEREILDDVLQAMRRRFVAAAVVGLLAFGVPSTRSAATRTPPALVRVQTGPGAGAEAWRSFFEPLRAELN
jgi:hypothetical protein